MITKSKYNKIVYGAAVILVIVFLLWALSGCATAPVAPCASTPVEVPTTEVRYVPIDSRLTVVIPDPGPQLVPGVTVSGALQSAANRGNALARANQRLVCIAAVQARNVALAALSDCGADLAPVSAAIP